MSCSSIADTIRQTFIFTITDIGKYYIPRYFQEDPYICFTCTAILLKLTPEGNGILWKRILEQQKGCELLPVGNYTEIEKKKKGKIVQDRLGCLFKQFVAVYLIAPLTSNKMLTSTPCFWGWLSRAVALWGTRCCAGPWLRGSQLPIRA